MNFPKLHRASFLFVCCIGLGMVRSASAQFANPSFETGDLTGWNVAGAVSVQTNSIGTTPANGTYQALLATVTDVAVPAATGVQGAALEAFFGLSAGSLAALGNGPVVLGTGIAQTLVLQPGQIVTFSYDFQTNQVYNDGTANSSAPDVGNDDFAFASVSWQGGQAVTKLNDVFAGYAVDLAQAAGFDTSFALTPNSASTPFISELGYGTSSFTAVNGELYTIGAGVAHAVSGTDNGVNSAVLLDNFTVTPVAFNLSMDTPTVFGGQGAKGTVSFSFGTAAPGTMFTVATDQPGLVVCPGSPVSMSGVQSQQFLLSTSPVAVSTLVNVSVVLGGTTNSVPLTLNPAVLMKVVALPASIVGGSNASGAVVLSGATPVAESVALASDNTAVTVPPSVTIGAGTGTVLFTLGSVPVDTPQTAHISAMLGGTTVMTSITVNPPTPALVQLTPSVVNGGKFVPGSLYSGAYVYLSGKAGPSGALVTLSSSNQLVQVPTSVLIAAGSNSAHFQILTPGVDSTITSIIGATFNGGTQSATLTVNPAPLANFVLTSYSIKGGNSVTGIVSLDGVAGPAGVMVSLGSMNQTLASLPPFAFVPPGSYKATFTVTTSAVANPQNVPLEALYGGVSKVVNLTLNP